MSGIAHFIKNMKTYRFYIKMYRDVDAKNPEEAKKKINEVIMKQIVELDDKFRHFTFIQGVHDNEPEEQ